MPKKKRKHTTTKNTVRKQPITRLRVIRVECNGGFDLVTDFETQEDFNKIFMEWFNSPYTVMWNDKSLIAYIKTMQPKRICLLQADYDKAIEGKGVTDATEAEWLAEQEQK